MDNESTHDPRIIEALEACRPGSGDLADPELAFLASCLAASPELDDTYERLQRLDKATAQAFGDVPVPEGLAGRILDRLALARGQESVLAARPTEPSPQPLAIESSSAEPVAVAAPPRKRVSRRRWLIGVGGLGLAVAGSLLVGVILRDDHEDVVTGDQVLAAGMRLFENEPAASEGLLVARNSPPKELPISPLVVQHSRIRWHRVSGFLGRDGVAYDLTRPGGPQATLYVVAQAVADVPSDPPPRPTLSTHNRSIAAWQSGRLLYVLVVDGGPAVYRSYLDMPRGPVA